MHTHLKKWKRKNFNWEFFPRKGEMVLKPIWKWEWTQIASLEKEWNRKSPSLFPVTRPQQSNWWHRRGHRHLCWTCALPQPALSDPSQATTSSQIPSPLTGPGCHRSLSYFLCLSFSVSLSCFSRMFLLWDGLSHIPTKSLGEICCMLWSLRHSLAPPTRYSCQLILAIQVRGIKFGVQWAW